MAKLKFKKHGILIAYGILIPTPKPVNTRWIKLIEEIKQNKDKYDVELEENCVDHVFIYDKKTSFINYNISELYPTPLHKLEYSNENIIRFLQALQIDKIITPNICKYLIHIWR